MNPGTVSFDKRFPNFVDKSASNDEFWNPTSIIPILTLEPVNVEFELLCGLSLLYEKVESFHAIELADLVTVGLVFTGAVGREPVSDVGVLDDVEPPPPPQLTNNAVNAIRIDFFLKLYFFISSLNFCKLAVITIYTPFNIYFQIILFIFLC